MKVLMWSRVDLFDIGGGDLIQMQTTAKELKKLGVESKISTDINEDISAYDLIHVFQMDWTPETYFYAKKAKEAGKPLVVSPIHHSVKEVTRFDNEYAFGFRKIISFFFKEQHQRDTWKNIYRSLKNPKKAYPTLMSIIIGLKNMHTKTLSFSDAVLVQTEAEAKDLKDTYGVDINWAKVPNGVGDHFLLDQEYPSIVDVEDYILCVGRVEARKNNVRIIEAVEEFIKEGEIDVQLVFTGKKNANHGSFLEEFDKKVSENSWLTYIPHTPWEEIPALFHHAKVLVSASWFETSGLTILEALFSGTNAVAAGSRAREIAGDHVSYCDPGDVSSIKNAIREAYNAPRPEIPAEMKEEYTWENVAKRTHAVYEDLLKN
ncbi:glycosyltransferase [candidate division WWE3 bacterium]|jgi:glycosyltransferase involved in cell wall biosynthesis|nr:glycosyltransferase [candidate division WWE3 bacterium]MBT7349455.1 glycosyltransferase [candidate division WWE3 bacterium]